MLSLLSSFSSLLVRYNISYLPLALPILLSITAAVGFFFIGLLIPIGKAVLRSIVFITYFVVLGNGSSFIGFAFRTFSFTLVSGILSAFFFLLFAAFSFISYTLASVGVISFYWYFYYYYYYKRFSSYIYLITLISYILFVLILNKYLKYYVGFIKNLSFIFFLYFFIIRYSILKVVYLPL